MKFLFFFILLVNSFFFLWEYRKGAPEIYLKHTVEKNNAVQQGANKIILVSELIDTPAVVTTPVKLGVTKVKGVIREPIFTGPRQEIEGSESHVAKAELIPEGKVSSNFVGPLIEVINSTELAVNQQDKFVGPLLVSVEKNANPLGDELQNSEPTEPMEEAQNLDSESLVKAGQEQSNESSTINGTLTSAEKIAPVRICYLLQEGQSRQALQSQASRYLLEFVEHEQRYISNYLVLTSAAKSLQGARAKEQVMRQQGIAELWVFRKGEFKWQISLGLFNTKRRAARAYRYFSSRTTEVLNVVPSYKTKKNIQVFVNLKPTEIPNFEENFSSYLDTNTKCSSDTP